MMDQQSMESPAAHVTPLERAEEPVTLEASPRQGTGRRRLVAGLAALAGALVGRRLASPNEETVHAQPLEPMLLGTVNDTPEGIFTGIVNTNPTMLNPITFTVRNYGGIPEAGFPVPVSQTALYAFTSGVGTTNAAPDRAAVCAKSDEGGFGVYAVGTGPSAFGVVGTGTSGTGVHGASTSGHGMIGISTTGFGVWGSSNGFAVVGTAKTGPGVYGYSQTGEAGQFVGTVTIYGNLQVIGGAKNAIVPHPDGSHRRVYTVESPESYFEDFGQGQLVSGRAEVRLDDDFAALVHSDDYQVFITPEGDSQGLYIQNKTAEGFRVSEQQGGKSNLRFAYRIVARRKDIDLPRLDKVELAPSPDPRSFVDQPHPAPVVKRG
jgi:hypothetical protein